MMQFTRTLRHIAAIAALLIAGSGQARAQAPAPGSLIQPAGETPIQLARAQVRIEVLRVKAASNDLPPVAHIRSAFGLRNPTGAPVSQTIQLLLAETEGDPELEGAVLTLRGRPLPLMVTLVPRPDGAQTRLASAALLFPAGAELPLATEYFAQSAARLPYGRFRYLLSTGAGWAGPIESVEFVLDLPYPANAENVLLAHSSPGGSFVGGRVRWRFEALEPAADDTFFVTVLSPTVWERILAARRVTRLRPRSAQAWRALAQAYLSAVYVEGDGPQLGVDFVPQMEDAYRRAQTYAPASARLHAEFAQALLSLYPRDLPADVFEKLLAALSAALARDPRDALTQQVIAVLRERLTQRAQGTGPEAELARQQLAQLEQRLGGGATPTPEPATPTFTPVPTATPTPDAGEATPATPTPGAEAATPTPDIGEATLIPLPTPTPDAAAATPTAEPPAATDAPLLPTETPPADEATPTAAPDAALAVTDVAVPTAVVTLPGARAPTDAPAGPVVSAPVGLLLLALAYVLGGLTVYLIHSIRARRDRAQAEALILASSKDEDED